MVATSSRSAVIELLTMFDHVLEEDDLKRDHSFSLIWNLQQVRVDHWDMQPARCRRTIRELVTHIGQTWLMYSSRSFRGEPREWNDTTIDGAARGDSSDEIISWLRNCHAELRSDIDRLGDDDLSMPRETPWGESYETRRLIELATQHTLYHTGEINHLRALLQGNDGWYNEPIDAIA